MPLINDMARQFFCIPLRQDRETRFDDRELHLEPIEQYSPSDTLGVFWCCVPYALSFRSLYCRVRTA